MKCEVCGMPNQDKEQDFCYGCGHIICTDCCFDLFEDDLIGWDHYLQRHIRVFEKKVKLGTWVSRESQVKVKA